MSKSSVICIARTESQAISIVDALKTAGFSNNDISVLLPDKAGTRDFAHEQHTKAPEGAATGGVTGGVLGGALLGTKVLVHARVRTLRMVFGVVILALAIEMFVNGVSGRI